MDYAVIGSILSGLLAINAYLLKQFLESLNQVKMQTAILLERHTAQDKINDELKANQKLLFDRLRDLEIKQ